MALRDELYAHLDRHVRDILARRAERLVETRGELEAVRTTVTSHEGPLQERIAMLRSAADGLARAHAPFEPTWTVEQAWQRHPGVQAVFASFGLPACDGCSVRFDETLSEVADAYALPLPELMVRLRALL